MDKIVDAFLDSVISGGGATRLGSDYDITKVVGIVVDSDTLKMIKEANPEDLMEIEMDLVKRFHMRLSNFAAAVRQ